MSDKRIDLVKASVAESKEAVGSGRTWSLVLVASLQLALRHPKFNGTKSAEIVRDLVDWLIDRCPENRPNLRAILKAGDNPKMDLP